MFPVAFGIVSEETDDNWFWFLEHLKVAIGNRRDLVFVSDRNHGILEGVKSVFSESKHGYCYKHLTANLKDKFRGYPKFKREQVLKYFAGCAYAATKDEFDNCYKQLLDCGGEKILKFLSEVPKENWSNAYFEGRRFGQMTSNSCESWNSQIREKRLLPITNFIDAIRILLMNQMNDRRENAATWSSVLCKNVEKRMRKLVDKGKSWVAVSSCDYIWEVFSSPNAVVDLRERTCSCRQW